MSYDLLVLSSASCTREQRQTAAAKIFTALPLFLAEVEALRELAPNAAKEGEKLHALVQDLKVA